MTKEGMVPASDPAQLINNLFALLPVPVAIADDHGEILLSNSSFSEIFEGVRNVHSIPHHEFDVMGRGIFEFESLPLNDRGMTIVYAKDVTNEVALRRQAVHMEKMAGIGRLVSGVAHELNNPLAGILGYAQLIARSDLDAGMRRMMDVILTQAERAGNIVQNFLNLAAKTDPKRVAFDLNGVVRNVARLREYQEKLENIMITLDLAERLPAATGDHSQIEQVLLNLVVNAEDAIVDAQRRPGLIQIRTGVENGRIQLSVTDNGSGIHARDIVRIFDPFFTTKEKQHGTGLGLSICADIVKDHGGDLYAWSTYGSGSTFVLELPIRHGVVEEQIRPERAFNERSLCGKSILVIDDEIHITGLICDVLIRQGAEVELSNSGIEALERLKERSYDVIVCDQRMPGMSGRRLFRVVESLYPNLQRRFLFVTGDIVNAHTRQFLLQTGVNFIRKPFRIQELIDAVEELLSRDP